MGGGGGAPGGLGPAPNVQGPGMATSPLTSSSPLTSTLGGGPLSSTSPLGGGPLSSSVNGPNGPLSSGAMNGPPSSAQPGGGGGQGPDKQNILANEKRRRRRESHNAVERRRRDNINEKISELATLIPEVMLEGGGEFRSFAICIFGARLRPVVALAALERAQCVENGRGRGEEKRGIGRWRTLGEAQKRENGQRMLTPPVGPPNAKDNGTSVTPPLTEDALVPHGVVPPPAPAVGGSPTNSASGESFRFASSISTSRLHTSFREA